MGFCFRGTGVAVIFVVIIPITMILIATIFIATFILVAVFLVIFNFIVFIELKLFVMKVNLLLDEGGSIKPLVYMQNLYITNMS